MTPRLVALDGEHEGQVYPVFHDWFSIGRSPSNLLVVNDQMVSRAHCALQKTEGIPRILDLKSANGTWVNGGPVDDTFLSHGDHIRIGRTTLLFLTADYESPA